MTCGRLGGLAIFLNEFLRFRRARQLIFRDGRSFPAHAVVPNDNEMCHDQLAGRFGSCSGAAAAEPAIDITTIFTLRIEK